MNNRTWSRQKLILIAAVLLLAIVFPHIAPYTALASEILIFGLFAMAFDLCLGYAGMLSFGHATFFGLGAYTAGIILKKLAPSVPLALLGAVIMSSLAGLIIGFLTIRRRGIYFTMVTLAFAQMFYFIAFKWTDLTGGDDGLQQVPRPWLGPLNLQSQMVFYYFLLFSVIVSAVILIRVVNSPFGKTLQAQRENRNRAMSIGYDVDKFKLTAFIISAFFSGLAGGFYALLLNFVPLSSLHWTNSGEVVVMTITGGMGTLFGPFLGAVGIILLRDIISDYTESWGFIMGILFMAAVLGFRSGLIGILRTKLRLNI